MSTLLLEIFTTTSQQHQNSRLFDILRATSRKTATSVFRYWLLQLLGDQLGFSAGFELISSNYLPPQKVTTICSLPVSLWTDL